MQRGICKLCSLDSDLQDSHLIPASIYKRLHSQKSPNPNPVFIGAGVSFQTSRQVTAYLLCSKCENQLNARGERQILPLLADEDQTFPLYQLLVKGAPDLVTEIVTAYAAVRNPEIPVEALAHFALGIFWKASVHHWHGSDRDLLINLGPYEEKLRLFVREPEKNPFPDNVALMIAVVPPPRIPLLLSVPIRGPNGDGFRNFRFYVPGLQFVLSIGKSLDREVCFKSNPLRPIFVQDVADAVNAIPRRMFLEGKARNEIERRTFGDVLSGKRRKSRR